MSPLPLQFLLLMVAGWMTRDQRAVPARSPNLNAYAERFVRSVRDECLSKVIPLGEQHLRELLREYLAHCHAERNHQGLDNVLIEPANDNQAAMGPVLRRKRLGAMLSYYHRAAA
jgi:transposase InsO family protein